ncbi:hypothetical protein NOF04DRAFT_1332389 [Fusarium oxysporum II5]|nr:hypothetical protein NOF04DRAFT_1332389 [Fusarium oxysporum II5]
MNVGLQITLPRASISILLPLVVSAGQCLAIEEYGTSGDVRCTCWQAKTLAPSWMGQKHIHHHDKNYKKNIQQRGFAGRHRPNY